jgi:uncharacterized protein YyaL (SSP411 family)
VGDRNTRDTIELIRTVHSQFDPQRIILLLDSDETRRALSAGIPSIAAMTRLGGRAAAYVCRDYTCQLPVSEVARLAELLQ